MVCLFPFFHIHAPVDGKAKGEIAIFNTAVVPGQLVNGRSISGASYIELEQMGTGT
jgi:hypothetical protein